MSFWVFWENSISLLKVVVMKKLTILLIFVFCSCQIEYDGQTKLVIKGKITDNNNVAIANKEINLYVISEGGTIPFLLYVPSEENNIGKTRTDNLGNYTMIIPKPSNFTEIIIETNSNNNGFSRNQIVGITLDNFINYTFTAPTIKLYKKEDLSALDLVFIKINTSNQINSVEYNGEWPQEFINLNSSNNSLNYFSLQKLYKKNTLLIVNYKVLNTVTNIETPLSQNINIGNTDVTSFTINY